MNIYKILEALKNVEESMASEIDQLCHEWLNSEYAPMDDDSGDDRILTQKAAAFLRGTVAPEHIEIYAQEMARAFDGGLYEADYPFAGKAVGQKAGDQVRGQEKAKPTAAGGHPFKGRLVGAMESIAQECDTSMSPLEKKLRARWEQTKAGLQEYGMTTGGTANPTANASSPDPTAVAKDLNTAQQNLNKLKSAGVNLPTGVSQAAKSAVGAVNDPTKVPTQQDKNISMNLGGEVEQLLTKADPGQVQQVANILKKVKQG